LVALVFPASALAQPNVVVVMTDDQRADTIRHMPNLWALAREGTKFTRHYAVQPLCCPSRASFLTGQYPHNHGVIDNFPERPVVDALERRALPVVMQEAGYHTGFFGKYLNPYGLGNGTDRPPGWDEWLGILNRGTVRPFHDIQVSNGSTSSTLPGYETDALRERAEDFITRNAGAPFFLAVMPRPPHNTRLGVTAPAPEDRGSFATAMPPLPRDRLSDKPWFPSVELPREPWVRQWRRQLEALQAVDRMVGGIVERLQAIGELDNTVIFYTSDNGYLMGEHRLSAKDLPYRESARVPLIASGPGFARGAQTRVTANIDLPVTIAALAGTSMPDADGRHLFAPPRRVLLLEGGRFAGYFGGWRALVWHSGRTFIDWRGPHSELYRASDRLQLHALGGHRKAKRNAERIIARLR
jgi:N-acetylglucosamine-6-sulfatase